MFSSYRTSDVLAFLDGIFSPISQWWRILNKFLSRDPDHLRGGPSHRDNTVILLVYMNQVNRSDSFWVTRPDGCTDPNALRSHSSLGTRAVICFSEQEVCSTIDTISLTQTWQLTTDSQFEGKSTCCTVKFFYILESCFVVIRVQRFQLHSGRFLTSTTDVLGRPIYDRAQPTLMAVF